MASDVEICNLALVHIGDAGLVTSIVPPDSTAQAIYCARYYAQTRDSTLELLRPRFANRRAPLALLTATPPSAWLYAYAIPSDCLVVRRIVPADSTDDEQDAQPYVREALADGTPVVYTNQADAVGHYTARITSSALFSALFVEALTWYLAARLAGPLIKGDKGAEKAKHCLQQATYWKGLSKESDANQARPVNNYVPASIRGRR